MTSAAELALLEAQYTTWINAGCPNTYSINGRMVSRTYWEFLIKRIDQLRISAARESSTGTCPVSQFRRPD